jgi:hypothetical protein
MKGAAIKRLILLSILLAAVADGPAYAKGPTTAALCGPDGCESLGSGEGLGSIAHGYRGPLAGTPAPAPYFELRFTSRTVEGNRTWTTWYVPSAGMFAGFSYIEGSVPDDSGAVNWMRIEEPRLIAASQRLRPFAKPEITAVTIGDRRMTANVDSYIALFTVETIDRNLAPPGIADWVPITFVSKQRSPWTTTESGLKFAPSKGMLSRGVELVKLPDEMAADLRGGEPLSAEGSGFPWRTFLVPLLAGLVLLGAAFVMPPLRRSKTA